VTTDLAYAQPPGHRPLRLDVYAAAGDAPRPLVVFVHGGAWTGGTKRLTGDFEPYPEALAEVARAGFVVASVEYRLSGEAPFPAAVEDVRAALDWLIAGENRFGIDPRRVGVWGASAGAHLAAFAALGCDGGAARCPRAFVGWYGPYDLAGLFAGADPAHPGHALALAGTRAFLGCAEVCAPARLAEASPLALAGPGDPATLLVHGSDDALVRPEQSAALAARLAAAGVPVETVILEGAGHGWAAPTAALSGKASRRALAATVAFFGQALRLGP
jgi:acetyl esterase/lipase